MMTGMVFAQDITFSKKEIVDMTVEQTVKSSCTTTIRDCLKISAATCEADIKSLLYKDCSTGIPETVSDMEKFSEYVGQLAGCAVKGLFAKHNSSFQKNITSAACKALQ